MAKNWDYAELSKAAKEAGGPEKYAELLELTSKNEGEMEMIPWIGVAAAGASFLTFCAIKAVNYFKKRREEIPAAIEEAKKEIIEGIKEYDGAHNDNEEGDVDDE